MKPDHLGRRLTKRDFETDPVSCATALIGTTFVWDGCGGVVVETEAYAQHGDEACRTFVRTQAREFVITQPAGTIYTYLNYGVHWLFNVLTKSESGNGFVLIRAIEPTLGIETMQARRGRQRLKELCSGPGKLTQALGIGPESHCGNIAERQKISGPTLRQPTVDDLRGFYLTKPETDGTTFSVVADKRIGITKAADYPWRFLLGGSKFLSKPPTK